MKIISFHPHCLARHASCIAIFALHTQPADIIPRPFDRKILLPSPLPLNGQKVYVKIYKKLPYEACFSTAI